MRVISTKEIKAWCDYHLVDTPRYWRSKSRFEVDFVFDDWAVEVKAKQNVGSNDLKGIRAFQEEGLAYHHVVVCMEAAPRTIAGVEMMPWARFLDMLWNK